MGQSNIAIDFKQKANTAVSRSARGVACIIAKDTTVEGLHTYTRKQQIKESYATETKELLEIPTLLTRFKKGVLYAQFELCRRI